MLKIKSDVVNVDCSKEKCLEFISDMNNYRLLFPEDKISEWNKIGNTENTSKLNNNFSKTYNKLLASLKIDKQELTKIKSKLMAVKYLMKYL
mgnify:CR=1 FL=1